MSRLSDLTDFHAHILPGADHGSKNIETTEKQLKMLYSEGVESVVATPHFYPNEISVDGFLTKRDNALKELSALSGKDKPRIYVGAEVLVCPGIERMPGLEKLCISGTNVILLEMPFYRWSESLYETVYNVSRSGLTVVMAHIGRYHSYQADRLIAECGVSVQINGENIETRHGRKKVYKWLDSGIVAAFGSDIHGTSTKYAKNLAALYEFADEYAEEVKEKSRQLLNGAKHVKMSD